MTPWKKQRWFPGRARRGRGRGECFVAKRVGRRSRFLVSALWCIGAEGRRRVLDLLQCSVRDRCNTFCTASHCITLHHTLLSIRRSRARFHSQENLSGSNDTKMNCQPERNINDFHLSRPKAIPSPLPPSHTSLPSAISPTASPCGGTWDKTTMSRSSLIMPCIHRRRNRI